MHETTKKVRLPTLARWKRQGRKITMLTAYDATMAALLDRAGIDALLVGDSLGMVVLGHETTIPVTLDAMVHHAAAVTRGAQASARDRRHAVSHATRSAPSRRVAQRGPADAGRRRPRREARRRTRRAPRYGGWSRPAFR